MSDNIGVFYGVGVGPGDPELITLKSYRCIQQADVISYIANEKGGSQAKTIAVEALSTATKAQLQIPVVMPMSNDRSLANAAYDQAASDIAKQLHDGRDVAFICEGDPLFFGSFAYLLERLQNDFRCQVLPGISSVHAASSALQIPLTMLKESFAVVSGRHSDQQICDVLNQHDSVVIMKAGRERQRLLALIAESGRSHEANYLSYISREQQTICRDVSELADEPGPYFSLFVIIRAERDR